ncbi:MAG TPA: hypothetical protein VJ797_15760 [Burkholderiales bacterium]|nr:hypothetical protein [Burkholderiales bacterium]
MKDTLPTKRQVIEELRKEIDAWRSSYRNHKTDEIDDPVALHAIRCLEVALLIVREHFPRRKR